MCSFTRTEMQQSFHGKAINAAEPLQKKKKKWLTNGQSCFLKKVTSNQRHPKVVQRTEKLPQGTFQCGCQR